MIKLFAGTFAAALLLAGSAFAQTTPYGPGPAPVDLTRPGPIGSNSPSTIAGTKLTVTPPANADGIDISGMSLTGASGANGISITGTWNTSGTGVVFSSNMTCTSCAQGYFEQFEKSGSLVYYIDQGGNEYPSSAQQRGNTWALNALGTLYLNSNSSCIYMDALNDVSLCRQSANTLEIGTTSANALGSLLLANMTASGAAVNFPGLAASSAATTGSVCWTTSTGNVTVDTTLGCLSSDIRTKWHVKPLGSMLAEIMALKPIEYENRPGAGPASLGREIGLSAQAVQKVDPRLVGLYAAGPKKGAPQGVRYMQLTAGLVKAIQEQQVEIMTLKAEMAALEVR